MDKKRFLIFQHEAFEEPGYILEWIIKNGHSFSIVKLYLDDPLPVHLAYDVLIIMGGSMGVADECRYPWLVYEKRFIREAINRGKKVLGVCLGAQLIANVLGAKVYTNPEPEIGFFEITKSNHSNAFAVEFPDKAMVFHWHAQTFELPAGATLLASSEACQNQAFIYSNNVLALQYHLEITEGLLRAFFDNNNMLPTDKKFVQSTKEILNGTKYIPTCNILMDEILNTFITKTIEV